MKAILACLLAAGVGILWANLGHIGYSFRGPGYDPDRGLLYRPDGPIIVAVTVGEIERGERRAFFKRLHEVRGAMLRQRGLIGYGLRKEILGDRVWTLSAWEDRESLNQFVRSEAHQRAIDRGGIPAGTVHSVIFEVSAEELPIPWMVVEKMLGEQAVVDPSEN
ncbi:MAG: antibiotic biosynthesis monooxygenase family protein [Verrucomicrobiota bacterium]